MKTTEHKKCSRSASTTVREGFVLTRSPSQWDNKATRCTDPSATNPQSYNTILIHINLLFLQSILAVQCMIQQLLSLLALHIR